MASLTDLFNPTFLMFLGILVLVVALLVVYFESKMRDQNHKIASMLSLVSTLAEDINGIKMGMNHLAITAFGGSNMRQSQQPFAQTLDKEDEDDEDDEHDDDDDDNNNDTSKSKLINVSDDDDDDDDDTVSEQETDVSLLHSDSDDSDTNSEIDENIEELGETNDIKVLKLNITNELYENSDNVKEDFDNLEDLEVLEDNLSDTQSVELNTNNELHNEILSAEEIHITDYLQEKTSDNLISSNFKTISVNLEETGNENLDYKKLSLTKLRSIVAEKGLSTDSTKLKKQDLLKLLGVE
jgi:hypothetical protein